MLDNTIIKIKYSNNKPNEVINFILENKLPPPKYVFNLAQNIFKIKLQDITDLENYKKHFNIIDDKIYKYKIILNNDTVKNQEIEDAIIKSTGIKAEASKVYYKGIDTGVVHINSARKLEKNVRLIKVKSKNYKITCRDASADGINVLKVKGPQSISNDKTQNKKDIQIEDKKKEDIFTQSKEKEKQKVEAQINKDEKGKQKVITPVFDKTENKASIESESSNSTNSNTEDELDMEKPSPKKERRTPNLSLKNNKAVYRLLQEKSYRPRRRQSRKKG